MKIRYKLSLYFSIAGIVAFLLFGITIYLFSQHHRKEDFYTKLTQRVHITEKMFLEKNNFSEKDFLKITNQFLQTLPQEQEDVFKLSNNRIESRQTKYPNAFIKAILKQGISYFEKGDRQFAGKYFHVNGSDYLVIVTAIDEFGIEKMNYLKGIIIIGLVVSIILFSLLSIPLSTRIIKPLSYKIKMANMISANNLHQRLTGIKSNDEIGELAIAFNNLLDRIENAFEAKKAFISNASHEIRNPLTAIVNETDITLEKERTTEQYRDALKSISAESERMKLLIDNLLELSKISYAETRIQFKYLSLIPLLNEIIATYGFSNYENKIDLIISEETVLRNEGLWGNKNLLTSMLVNVIDNACKFSQNQDVRIELSVEAENIIITIRDQGIGIPEESISKVTEPFFRSPNARNTKGSGIGITLAQKIIEIHRGKLIITSVLDQGTEVKIIFPSEEPLKP